MSARVSKIAPLDLYVTAIILIGGALHGLARLRRRLQLPLLLTPEVAHLRGLRAVGELVPLKVFTRGAEGEVTTSTTLRAWRRCSPPARSRPSWRSPARTCSPTASAASRSRRSRFNISQYAITVAAPALVLELTHRPPARAEPLLRPFDLIRASCSPPASSSSSTPALVATVIALAQGAERRALPRQGPLLPGLDRRPDARPLAGRRARRRLLRCPRSRCSSCRSSPCTAAAARRSPRSTRRSTTRSPACRTARCSATASSTRSARRAAPAIRRGDADRPRPLQGDQRHARPPRAATCCCRRSSRRLSATLRDADTVARLGGDEFGVLLPRVRTSQDATVVAQQLLGRAARAVRASRACRWRSTQSIGIACTRRTATTSSTLNQRADIAMYSAKQSGRGHAIFEPRAGPPLAAPARAGRRPALGDQPGRDHALLPAQGGPRDRARSSASRRSRAGITPSSASSARPSSSRSPSRPA